MITLDDWRSLEEYGRAKELTVGDEQVEPIARGIVEGLMKNPLLLRYLSSRRSYQLADGAFGSQPIAEPWEVIGEKIAFAMSAAMEACGWPGARRWRWPYALDVTFAQYAMGLSGRTLMAQPFLFREEIVDLLKTAPDPPPGAFLTYGDLPYPIMYWTWETARLIQSADGVPAEVDQMMVTMHQGGIETFELEQPMAYTDAEFRSEEGRPAVRGGTVPYGIAWDDPEMDEASRAVIRGVLQVAAFLNSPYVDSAPTGIPRQQRRALARQGAPLEMLGEQVHVVTLRRSQRDSDSTRSEEEREWKHHWWVSGHYRNQWYPSLRRHKLIFVPPYLKGDMDKPLLEKIYDVAR